MQFPRYIEFKLPDSEVQYLFDTKHPHFYGVVFTGPPAYPLLQLPFAQVAGYDIVIEVKGIMHSNVLPFSTDINGICQQQANNMAAWYLVNVIGQRLSEFDRFLL